MYGRVQGEQEALSGDKRVAQSRCRDAAEGAPLSTVSTSITTLLLFCKTTLLVRFCFGRFLQIARDCFEGFVCWLTALSIGTSQML